MLLSNLPQPVPILTFPFHLTATIAAQQILPFLPLYLSRFNFKLPPWHGDSLKDQFTVRFLSTSFLRVVPVFPYGCFYSQHTLYALRFANTFKELDLQPDPFSFASITSIVWGFAAYSRFDFLLSFSVLNEVLTLLPLFCFCLSITLPCVFFIIYILSVTFYYKASFLLLVLNGFFVSV
uniref:Uncharacterized protein n=1 Tax=Anopheles darlingi TaxID=43151 RepID=A0A2M4CJN2_ANODA